MAEIGEVIEGIEGAEEAIDGAEEGIEDLPEEERAEIEAEIAEARTEVEGFSKVAESMKSLLKYVATKIPMVVKFVGKNVAIGAILWAVNVALSKMFPGKSGKASEEAKKKQAAIKALTTLIKTETELSKKCLDWMKEHKDDQITLDGFQIPMESVIAKPLLPISEATDAAFAIANNLKNKLDGKVYYEIPNGDDMRKFLTAGDAFLKGFSDLVDFIGQHVQKIPQLGSFPVKKADIDLLTTQLQYAKDLPLW